MPIGKLQEERDQGGGSTFNAKPRKGKTVNDIIHVNRRSKDRPNKVGKTYGPENLRRLNDEIERWRVDDPEIREKERPGGTKMYKRNKGTTRCLAKSVEIRDHTQK